ncbi:YihY/virulence factor BrkB family protein [Plastoroseomonas arctica]|uniref:YihY/virulence factor BrkB family protein n=1 Tax=Plastoroseomonas arctica TaxID=1509237 RepID=A0AAF1JWR8_9PROT|nr:YihY/virulence factor BrkB family protein [Plastoroseomonas arctica]MBR0655492.1 YihY/virulence factor BrkB family protein [Plastoroseomonas arctica]
MLKDTGEGFIADDCLTRAAGIAYFTLFSIGPLLFIATGIAGIVFGRNEIDEAIANQLTGMLGEQAGAEIRTMAQGTLGEARGGWAIVIGLGTLLLTAGGAFGALQTALNAIWKTDAPQAGSITEAVSRLVKAKAAALGLVATTGFILITSLAVSASIASMSSWFEARLPGGAVLAFLLNLTVTIAVLTMLFAAIYKVLPDRRLAWGDVMVGAFATSVLFTAGKAAIGLYIGHSDVAAGFGAAGTVIVVLVWLYYSAVIFLTGAEFTRAWANRNGSKQAAPIPAEPGEAPQKPRIDDRATGQRQNGDALADILLVAVPILVSTLVMIGVERLAPSRAAKPSRER